MIPAKPGQTPDPRPCAGRPGTQITVEDLFYNIPNRRRAFRSPSEEYTKILDVVTRYAVHCEHIAFSIKKYGEAGASFSVAAAANKIDRIRQAYGAAVVKDLIGFGTEDRTWGFKASGYCSTASYNSKRTTLLLFINHRSVESSAVKKAVEQSYQLFLPKGGHPFVYLNLEVDPARVDVNVHPTKREVHFLNEDEIIDLVCANIRERLTQVDTSRTFKTQTLIPTISPHTIKSRSQSEEAEVRQNPRTPAQKRPYENNLVRTDARLRKITSMLPLALTPAQLAEKTTTDNSSHSSALPAPITYVTTDRSHVPIRLTSIKTLRASVRDEVHASLTEIFTSLTYVGLVDPFRRLAAMQSGVNLYLVDYGLLSNELFYQIGITDFGNFGAIQLRPSESPPIPLIDLLLIAADLEVRTDASLSDLSPAEIAQKVYTQLYDRREMLKEYFSLEISDEGHLLTIPLLIKNYLPSMPKLPTFLLRLGPFVTWSDELECFRTFLVELAAFYVPEKLPSQKQHHADDEGQQQQQQEQESDADDDAYTLQRAKEIEHALEHVLFPAFRSRLLATQGMLRGVVEIADLKGLYRVFERC